MLTVEAIKLTVYGKFLAVICRARSSTLLDELCGQKGWPEKDRGREADQQGSCNMKMVTFPGGSRKEIIMDENRR